MKFRHKDSVEIVEGFYKGERGKVVHVDEYSGNNVKLVGTLVYTVEVTNKYVVPEECLELISRPKKDKTLSENEEEEDEI